MSLCCTTTSEINRTNTVGDTTPNRDNKIDQEEFKDQLAKMTKQAILDQLPPRHVKHHEEGDRPVASEEQEYDGRHLPAGIPL